MAPLVTDAKLCCGLRSSGYNARLWVQLIRIKHTVPVQLDWRITIQAGATPAARFTRARIPTALDAPYHLRGSFGGRYAGRWRWRSTVAPLATRTIRLAPAPIYAPHHAARSTDWF